MMQRNDCCVDMLHNKGKVYISFDRRVVVMGRRRIGVPYSIIVVNLRA
jgi:hypothetical protein